MRSKSFRFSILTAVSALTLSTVAFGTNAFAADTPSSPSPAPVVSTDSGASDDAEISTLLTSQPEVADPQETDVAIDANNAEDAQEQASFDDDVKAAVLAGDSASAAQLTAAAAIVTTIDAPVVQAVAADDAEAHTLIIGLPQK